MPRDWILATVGVAIPVDATDRVSTVSLEKPDQQSDANLDDDKLILRLLAGFHEDETGRPITSYLAQNSPEECRARAALARQIRDGTLVGIARELLSLAIDPGTSSMFPDMLPTTQIAFTNKARRNKSTWARDRLVIQFIKQWLRENVSGGQSPKEEAAKYAAEKYFKIGRSRIAEIWQQHKKQISESAK